MLLNVTQVRALPAQRGGYSLVVMPEWATGTLERNGHLEIWAHGDATPILEAVLALELPVRAVFVATDTYNNTLWEPLIFTFDYLTALSLLTGVVTLVGLLLYLESQAPQWRRSYVLLRRMGITRRSHRRALTGELAMPLLAGLLGGLGITAGLIWALESSIDMNPDRLPDTVIDVPYPALGGIIAMTIVVAFAAVSYAQARVGRAQPSEVLRDVD